MPSQAEDLVPERFRPVLEAVVARIAAQDFAGLKRDGIDPTPDDVDLVLWAREYGATGVTLIPLPEEAWHYARAFPLDERTTSWAVIVDLWTKEEGRSDLSLEATVVEGTEISVVIDDLHVM